MSARTLRWLITLFPVLVFSTAISAKDYQVEAILFANESPQSVFESTHYKAIEELQSEAQTWILEPSMLLEEARSIADAADYSLLAHFSWGQEALPSSEAAIFSIAEQYFHGWIKVYASHLLFANLDLDFNGYRMNEKRRLKLDEVHYFDHPRFGVLLRVSRLEPDPDGDELETRLENQPFEPSN